MTSEGGVRPQRIEFVRESSEGVTPANPSWNLYSDTVKAWWDWEPDINVESDRAGGDPDIVGHYSGAETHDATISYRLQQWFVDTSGNPLDAAGDALVLDSDNSIKNTHTVVSREEHSDGGSANAGVRIYHVGKGGHPSDVTVPFETESGLPVENELNYQFEKFRTYKISQPASATTVDITNNGTVSVDVTIESEGAATSETNTVAGGSTVTTTSSYSDIDAVELSNEVDGDVVVSNGTGTTFMTIQGKTSYDHGEGDLGVPALGTGSHASAIGTDYVQFLDDDYDFSGTPIAAEIISGELSVDLNLEDNTRLSTPKRNIHSTGRTVEWSATVAGETASVDQVVDYLTGSTYDITWTADEGSITGPSARYTSPGSSSFEPQQSKHQRSITLESQGLTVN